MSHAIAFVLGLLVFPAWAILGHLYQQFKTNKIHIGRERKQMIISEERGK